MATNARIIASEAWQLITFLKNLGYTEEDINLLEFGDFMTMIDKIDEFMQHNLDVCRDRKKVKDVTEEI